MIDNTDRGGAGSFRHHQRIGIGELGAPASCRKSAKVIRSAVAQPWMGCLEELPALDLELLSSRRSSVFNDGLRHLGPRLAGPNL